ncbi:MAG: S1C family serine protease [bacterium]|nr:S1C family serine protease [bacterium]
MPESDKKNFMNEKIIGRQKTRKSTVKRVILFCLAAILFGAIVTMTFVCFRPWLEKTLGKGQKRETAHVTIPKDESEPEVIPETMETVTPVMETTTESESTEESEEALESKIQEVLENYTFTMDDLQQLYGKLRQVAVQADKGIVKVRSVTQGVDWFDNLLEKEGQFSAALIARTEDELIFIAPLQAVQDADVLEISLSANVVADGYVKQRDSKMGIAVISADVHQIEDTGLYNLLPIPLGNSWSVSQGDFVIAVGSPAGMVHSTMIGSVSYIEKNVRVTDGVSRMLYTDMQCESAKGTYLIDTKGQLIGWVTDGASTDESSIGNTSGSNFAAAYGISDYKGILEKLSNGVAAPYLGIYGQEVSASMIAGGMPAGVYVVQCQNDSPAYSAGIQNGDIITEIGDTQVHTMKEFQVKMETLQTGQNVTVKVMRNGRDAYKEIVYHVVLGSR